LGVEVITGHLVETVDGDEVVLQGGERIRAKTLVWSAGVKPEALAGDDEVSTTKRSRRIEVDGHFRIRGVRNAFAIGDIAGAHSADDGQELPMLSAPAMQAGRYVADFITSSLPDLNTDEPGVAPFTYIDKGTMATIGRNAAVCSVGSIELTGFLGWLAWLVVHIYYLIGYRNRLVVLWSWCWNYVWYDRPVRIITRAKAVQAPVLPPHGES
jgi:NADH dehydrogenase